MIALVKTLHLLGAFAWMAALFYLPRLFVYHATHHENAAIVSVLSVMERRLFRVIATPAMVTTWIAGGVLTSLGSNWTDPELWLIVKIALLLVMTGFHFLLLVHLRQISRDGTIPSQRYFRLINEVPTVLLVGILASAVYRFS